MQEVASDGHGALSTTKAHMAHAIFDEWFEHDVGDFYYTHQVIHLRNSTTKSSQVKFLIPIIQRAASVCKQKTVCVRAGR
jgi:hypothetical protein